MVLRFHCGGPSATKPLGPSALFSYCRSGAIAHLVQIYGFAFPNAYTTYLSLSYSFRFFVRLTDEYAGLRSRVWLALNKQGGAYSEHIGELADG